MDSVLCLHPNQHTSARSISAVHILMSMATCTITCVCGSLQTSAVLWLCLSILLQDSLIATQLWCCNNDHDTSWGL